MEGQSEVGVTAKEWLSQVVCDVKKTVLITPEFCYT